MLNAVPQEHHAYLYIALCCNELPPEDRESMVSLLYEPAKTTLMEVNLGGGIQQQDHKG